MDYLALKKMKIKYKFSAKISMKRQRNCGFKMQFLDILSSYICYNLYQQFFSGFEDFQKIQEICRLTSGPICKDSLFENLTKFQQLPSGI